MRSHVKVNAFALYLASDLYCICVQYIWYKKKEVQHILWSYTFSGCGTLS